MKFKLVNFGILLKFHYNQCEKIFLKIINNSLIVHIYYCLLLLKLLQLDLIINYEFPALLWRNYTIIINLDLFFIYEKMCIVINKWDMTWSITDIATNYWIMFRKFEIKMKCIYRYVIRIFIELIWNHYEGQRVSSWNFYIPLINFCIRNKFKISYYA